MKLINYRNNDINNPWTEIENLLNTAFNFSPLDQSLTGRARYGLIPVNYLESETEKHVEAEVPGVNKEDISLDFADGILSINAKRKFGSGDELTEIESSRKVKLGTDVDPESVNASLENGVLRIVLKKREAALPKRIAIEG